MSNEIKLKSIATFQPGIYIRENNYADEPAAYLLSLRDFDDQLRYRGTAARIDPEKVRDKYILTETDLLFSTRQKFNAFLLPDTDRRSYIASNSFAIIRARPDLILNEYLHWYLNHPDTQKRLQYIAQGQSKVNYISMEDLGELPILIPPVRRQAQIVHLYKLRQKEQKISDQLNHQKELYLQSILLKSAKHE